MRPLKLAVPLLAIVVCAWAVFAQPNSSDSLTVISAVAPIYPPIARQARAASDTTVEIQVDREGKVTSAESRGGHPLFRKVAEEAAQRWVFSAASTETKRKVALTFSFRILPSKTTVYEATSVYYPPYKIEIRVLEPIVNQ
ncbi:MAG: energy transducer TonB [Acidobacteria bacterium]|nr:energy transducer TonB [Acidobacteriota bacterium]